MSPVARLLLKIMAIPMVLIGFYVYSESDKAANYVKTPARVTSVEELCYLEKKSGGKTSTTEAGPCEDVRALNRRHPAFQDYKLVTSTTVNYKYESPVDNSTYYGHYKYTGRGVKLRIEEGDEVTVLAHKKIPDKSQWK